MLVKGNNEKYFIMVMVMKMLIKLLNSGDISTEVVFRYGDRSRLNFDLTAIQLYLLSYVNNT